LEYCVGDGEVMTFVVSVDFGRLQSFNVVQAARRCTPSILSMLCLVWGDHDEDAYSNCGCTKVLYAIALTWIGHFFVFLEIKARVELAFLQILSTCSLKVSLESMVMPKYLADGTKLSILYHVLSRYQWWIFSYSKRSVEPHTCLG